MILLTYITKRKMKSEIVVAECPVCNGFLMNQEWEIATFNSEHEAKRYAIDSGWKFRNGELRCSTCANEWSIMLEEQKKAMENTGIFRNYISLDLLRFNRFANENKDIKPTDLIKLYNEKYPEKSAEERTEALLNALKPYMEEELDELYFT
jgi:hypothetical protein